MKKLILFLFSAALASGAAMAQPPLPKSTEKRPPDQELKAQGEHVKSSVDDLVHLRFRKAHEKHVAEARRRNRGIAKDLRSTGVALPPPPPPDNGKVIRKPH